MINQNINKPKNEDMNKWKNKLSTIIKNIDKDKTFQENELAFLAITSKIENPLRDKIAFELQNEFPDKIICREFTDKSKNIKRADLLVLNENEEVECVIEFKAHSDMIDIEQWVSKGQYNMKNDIEKSLLVLNNPEVYFVIFINYISKLPNVSYAIKYTNSIQKAIKLSYDKDKIITDWNNALKKNKFESNYEKVEIEGGRYFDSDVSVICLIHGPYQNNRGFSKTIQQDNIDPKVSFTTKQIDVEEEEKKIWVNKTSLKSVQLVEEIYRRLGDIIAGYRLYYGAKGWVTHKDDRNVSRNFIFYVPNGDDSVMVTFQIEETNKIDELIKNSDLDKKGYSGDGRYQIVIKETDLNSNFEIIKILATKAKSEYYKNKK